MRRTIKAVLIALAIAAPAVLVPAVSASAATNPVPSNPGPSCNQSACAPSTPAIVPKDPSQDVAPPEGTVPLTVDGCDPTIPCGYTSNPEAQLPPANSDEVVISRYDFDQMNSQIEAAKSQAFVTLVCFIVMLIIVVALLIALIGSLRHQQPQVEEPAKAGPIFH